MKTINIILTTIITIIFQWNGNFIKSHEDNTIKLINLECECLPEYCSFVNCSIKPVNRSLALVNFNHMIKLNMTDVEITVIVSTKPLLNVQNNYRNLFVGKVNLCPILKHTHHNILLSPLFDSFMTYSNLLQGCPFRQDVSYYVIGAPVLVSIFPSLFPSGRYKLELNVTSLHTNISYIFLRGIADIRNKPLVFWK